MKNLLFSAVAALALTSCAAKTVKEVAQTGAATAAVLTQGAGALPVYTSFAPQKDSTAAITLGSIVQQSPNDYVMFQFVSTQCESCPADTRTIAAEISAGNIRGVSHQVVMTSGELFTDQLQRFATEANISTSSMLNDFNTDTTKAFYATIKKSFVVPLLVLLGKDGTYKPFFANADVSAEQHIQNNINEIKSIVNQ